jgi:hypothetical protein
MDLAMLDPIVGNEIDSLIKARHEWTEEGRQDFTNSVGA